MELLCSWLLKFYSINLTLSKLMSIHSEFYSMSYFVEGVLFLRPICRYWSDRFNEAIAIALERPTPTLMQN